MHNRIDTNPSLNRFLARAIVEQGGAMQVQFTASEERTLKRILRKRYKNLSNKDRLSAKPTSKDY
jgi:hypothetical protein